MNQFNDVSDVFLKELQELSNGCKWRMHWQTLMRLQKYNRIHHRCKSGSARHRNLLGVLGEEYIKAEYIYEALHSLGLKSGVDYRTRKRYKARRKKGDIDLYLNLRGKRFFIEIKNLECYYELDDTMKQSIINSFTIADKEHNGTWILFINKCRLAEMEDICRDNDIILIPIGTQITRYALRDIERAFRRTDERMDYFKNLVMAVFED